MTDSKRPFACALIDVQKAFSVGSWRQGLPEDHVQPIKSAFSECGQLLRTLPQGTPIVFAKCPFHLQSDTDFDESINNLLPPQSKTVIKPNTNILHDPAFTDWLKSEVLSRGIKDLLVGGCTTTSCVRVSSTSVQTRFRSEGLQVWVVLRMTGARLGNYTPRCPVCFQRYMDDGMDDTCDECTTISEEKLLSPVEKAKQDMEATGVKVVEEWPSEFVLE